MNESIPTTLMDGAGSIALQINPELRSLIPPLTAEEFAQLEANIVEEGCRDPLVVWRETRILLDGHNRYDICSGHRIPYTTVEVSLPSFEAAKAWMLANQLGRRNLTPEQMAYLRGEQYNLLKRQGKRTDRTFHQSDGKFTQTAEILAAQHHVSAPTIERDAAFARAVDTLAEALGDDVRHSILARESKLTQGQVKRLAAMATKSNPQTARHVLEEAQQAPTPKAAREIVRAAVKHDKYMDDWAQRYVLDDLGIAQCETCGKPLADPGDIPGGIGPICKGHPATPAEAFQSDDHQTDSPPFTLQPEPDELEPDEAPIDLAEAGRQDAERQAEIQAREYRQCVRLLGQLVEAYGFASVKTDVWDVVCAQWAPAEETVADHTAPPLDAAPEPSKPSGRSEKYGQLPPKVAAALQACGESGASAAMLAKTLGAERTQVWRCLNDMVKKEKAVKVGDLFVAKDAV